jgi:hypothetical protein
MEINLPQVHAEVTAMLARYQQALTSNDVPALDALFWNSPHAVRYGVGENLYGHAEIAAFRSARLPVGLDRTMIRTVVTTYGTDFATTNMEFQLTGDSRTRRQSQTWIRTPEGWRIASAHVSLMT